ncbi:MAG TPA: glycosyltransferase family 1 protein [Caulobacteraceae bacterium]
MTSMLAVNGRFRGQRLSGVQRVAGELVGRLVTPHDLLRPSGESSGGAGYAWEQFRLPIDLRGRLLWSPCNIGPVCVGRQVLTIHDAAVLDHPEWFSRTFVNTYRAIWRALVSRVAGLVTVSDYSRRRLCEHFGRPPASVHVVANAAGDRFSPACDEAVDSVRSMVGIEDRPYFLTLGTLEPRKNLQLVLKAWVRARPQLPKGARLLMIGAKGSAAVFSGDNLDLAAEGVVALGHVDDLLLPALLSGSWGLLYPSLYEGFGLPILEAMACGTPTVTTGLTSLPEVAGDAALYVDSTDDADLAGAIVRLAASEDLRQTLRAKGLERARAYSWSRSAGQMDEILAACL